MGLFLRNDSGRSELQNKIQKDINDRFTGDDKPPQIDTPEIDPRFLEGSHQTRPAGMIISLLLLVLIVVLVIGLSIA